MSSSVVRSVEASFSCPICLEVFSSHVSAPCGHNFCRTSITKFWDEQVRYKCPVCNERFHTRPALRVDTFISGMAEEFTASVQQKEPCAKPGGVPCKVCTGTKLKAGRSCLQCQTSYCHARGSLQSFSVVSLIMTMIMMTMIMRRNSTITGKSLCNQSQNTESQTK